MPELLDDMPREQVVDIDSKFHPLDLVGISAVTERSFDPWYRGEEGFQG